MKSARWGKIALLLVIVAAISAFFLLGLDEALTLANLKARRSELAAMVDTEPLTIVGGFFLLYVTISALSIPGAVLVLSLAAGAIFGLLLGGVIVSFASTIGASLAFLGARYLVRDWVRARLGRRMETINRGIARDGAFYLLTLRLIAVVPYFLVNLGMGLTSMRLRVFAPVSQVGMLPATLLYVNAGRQIAGIERPEDIMSAGLIGSLALLGLFPLVARFFVRRWRSRLIYKGFRKPQRYDRNLIVIGAGAGGLVTAYVAATARASVTLVEAHKMGGDCLNTGCVPSKALIRSARLAQEIRTAGRFGLRASDPQFSFAEVIERVHSVIREIEPADSIERYTGLGVDVRTGHARIVDPWTVEIDGRDRLTARSIVIAAGAEPVVPDIPGIAESGYLTSDSMWNALRGREAPPGRLAIIGGGPIGVEMAQAFARLGSRVTLVESGPCILDKEDEEVSALIAALLAEEGVDIRTNCEAVRVDGKALLLRATDAAIPFDELIVAVGRKPRLTGYGLEELGIDTSDGLATDEFLQTRIPNIYAVGDVAGPYQFTHFAAHQAWHAAVNALFGSFRRFRSDCAILPWTTFTDPEVAHVGHNELSARAADVAYEVTRYDLSHLDRAVTEGAARGFVKLLTVPGKDRILGATIVASNAGEMLAEIVLAMKHRLGLSKILGTIHSYPTMGEANRYAAGEWRRAHAPEKLLALAERYHRWRRK